MGQPLQAQQITIDAKQLAGSRAKAENGDAKAQYQLGVCYFIGAGVERNNVEAVKWFRKAADQNDAKAQGILGICFASGQGVARDAVKAVMWWRKAAEQNDARSQCNLGISYYAGQGGLKKDYAEAVKWYRKAAEENYDLAQFKLGLCYYAGEGVAKDDAEAFKWWRKSAEQNYPEAQYNLAGCYATGQCVEKDYAEAVKWYRKAAEQNFVFAQIKLAACYAAGQGVESDMVECWKWSQLAAIQGNQTANTVLKTLEEKLSAEIIAAGKRQAKDWLEQHRKPSTELDGQPLFTEPKDAEVTKLADPETKGNPPAVALPNAPKHANSWMPGAEPSAGFLSVQRAKIGKSSDGTGFLVASNLVVTSLHVVSGADSAEITFPSGLSRPITGIVAESVENDLAILAIAPTGAEPPPLPLVPAAAQIGDKLVMYGYPAGPSQKMVDGNVTSVAPSYGVPLGIITTAEIAHGFSGGPALNNQHQVAGVDIAGRGRHGERWKGVF